MSGEMNGEKCPQYKMKLKSKIIMGVIVVAVILELMSCGI